VTDDEMGVILPAPLDVILPDDIGTPVQPDVLFLCKENLPPWEAENIQGAPDLIVEVESPVTRWRDRVLKREAYLEAGVPECWLASSRTSTVTVLVLSEDGTRYVELGCFGLGDTLRSSLLPELAIRVDDLFFPA
jgi:Uma2 family endonuclease